MIASAPRGAVGPDHRVDHDCFCGKRPAVADVACEGILVPPGADLQQAIDAAPEGARLCLSAWNYTTSAPIVPKHGQQIVGVARDQTTVSTSQARIVFDVRGKMNVTLADLSVTGAVGSKSCKPECGKGIRPGQYTVIDNVRAHHNFALGISAGGPGVVIRNSEIDHNGNPVLYGCCSGGVKGVRSYLIENSYVHHNLGNGIWCDVGCSGPEWKVLDNVATDNTMGGIRYEISGQDTSALIQGNTVQRNNLPGKGGRGGIEINASRNVVVEDNTLGDNVGPGVIINGTRPPGVANILIRYNVLNGDAIQKCGGEVTCVDNQP